MTGGFTVQQGGLVVSTGATVQSIGIKVTGGLSVATPGGIVLTGMRVRLAAVFLYRVDWYESETCRCISVMLIFACFY